MATSIAVSCGICKAKFLSKNANFWCPECSEGLCAKCQDDYHKISKATQNHQLLKIEDYQKLPSEVLKLSTECTEHKKKFQMYCSNHDTACCPLCVLYNHKECDNNLSDIDELVKGFKSSAMLEDIENTVRVMGKNMNGITKDREQNITKLQNERETFLTEIKLTRKAIDQHLDYLEKALVHDMDIAVDTEILNIKAKLTEFRERTITIDKLKKDIEVIKKHASDLQAFLGRKSLEERLTTEESFFQSLAESRYIQNITLDGRIEESIKKITSTFLALGTVSIQQNPPTFEVTTEKEKQSQAIVAPASQGNDNIHLELFKEFKIKNNDKCPLDIRACTAFPDGKMAFVDYLFNKRLIMVNSDGSPNKKISLASSFPVDVICLDQTTVAVSVNLPNKIIMIDLETLIKHTFVEKKGCHGIAKTQETLIFATDKGCMRQIKKGKQKSSALCSPSDYSTKSITYIAASGDRIYYIVNETNTVICIDTDNKKVWEYENGSILRRPCGITVDYNSNVYVISSENNSVVVVSPDGKNGRIIISKQDAYERFQGICFCKETNRLLLVTLKGTVSLYSIC